jgi:hypothetical protein
MIVRILLVVLLSAVVVRGDDTPPFPSALCRFAFICHDTTVQQTIDRLGPPTRIRSDHALQYDLPDGSQVVLYPRHPSQSRSTFKKMDFFPKETMKVWRAQHK